jgi:putative transcriptional regulator
MRPRGAIRNYLRRNRLRAVAMTQQELADRVGVTRQSILSIEKGKVNPSVGLALRLAKTLGVTVEELFELEQGDVDG